jgi:predicted TIM-barrel fold metal-dependent hydrolase
MVTEAVVTEAVVTAEDQPYLVISADTHAGLPDVEYRKYLDPQYREAFDQDLAERRAMRATMARARGEEPEFVQHWYDETGEDLEGGWDVAHRDRSLDGDGVAGEVIFPDADAVRGGASAPFGAGLSLSGEFDGELLMAGAQAHNRWLAELCAESPARRRGLAIAPILHDVDAAVAEIRRAHASGLGGVMIPALWRPFPPYNHERYDPVWAVCEELGMPVHTHTGPAPRDEIGEDLGIYATETIWWTARPMWFLLWSGRFERFPGLRFAVTEGGCWWLADMLWKWDTSYAREHATKKMGDIGPKLRMLPSEYIDRNVKIGSSNTRRREIARRFEIGVGNIMWGNDFPHPEGTWPHTRAWCRETFWDCPVEDTRRILGLNAAGFYGFDTDALAPLAERIGPTPAEFGQVGVDLAKWDAPRRAGRHWLTGSEAIPSTVLAD